MEKLLILLAAICCVFCLVVLEMFIRTDRLKARSYVQWRRSLPAFNAWADHIEALLDSRPLYPDAGELREAVAGFRKARTPEAQTAMFNLVNSGWRELRRFAPNVQAQEDGELMSAVTLLCGNYNQTVTELEMRLDKKPASKLYKLLRYKAYPKIRLPL